MLENRALILDDDARICAFVSRVAKSRGYETCVIQQPEQFADSYLEFSPSLIMLDLQIGQQDSTGILKFLASEQVKTPIILMSGLERNIIEDTSLLAKSMQLTIAGVCSKPFESELLTNIFNRYYQNQPADRSADKIGKQDIINALQNQAIYVYYQPVYSLLNNAPAAIEFLARWKDEHGNLRLPSEFMHIIEQHGLLEKFTLHVLKAGLEKCLSLFKRNRQINISLNTPLTLLMNSELPEQLGQVLAEHDILPENIVLEIQNFTDLQDAGKAAKHLSRLRSAGFMLTVDNADSHAMSIIQQHALPFTGVKLDYGVLPQTAAQSNSENKTASLLDSVQRLGLDCCIKGIDSKEKFAHIKGLAVEHVQGDYICKPLPATAISVWIQ